MPLRYVPIIESKLPLCLRLVHEQRKQYAIIEPAKDIITDDTISDDTISDDTIIEPPEKAPEKIIKKTHKKIIKKTPKNIIKKTPKKD